jgi:hypothetical protein
MSISPLFDGEPVDQNAGQLAVEPFGQSPMPCVVKLWA